MSKTISTKDIRQYVSNYNKEVQKNATSISKIQLNIECVVGINESHIIGEYIMPINHQQILYYSSQYFIVYNLVTKDYTKVPKLQTSNQTEQKIIFIRKIPTSNLQNFIIIVQKSSQGIHVLSALIVQLGILNIQKPTLDIGISIDSTYEQSKYSWKLHKIFKKHNLLVENVSFHQKKGYLYFVISKLNTKTQQIERKQQQYLWVYDLKRQMLILNCEIKATQSKSSINNIYVSEEPTQIYLMGKGYFRFWQINFNEKHLKESNYRNIERAIKNKNIVSVFEYIISNSKYLAVLTENNVIFMNKNQLKSVCEPDRKALKQNSNKQNIELELESSLNQIYKMKFLFDEEDSHKLIDTQDHCHENISDADNFVCASQPWTTAERQICIAVTTMKGNVLVYKIQNFTFKLNLQYSNRKSIKFERISSSERGQIFILTAKNNQQVYVINQNTLSNDQENEIKQLWGEGNINKESILALDTPAIHNKLCTLSAKSTLQMWSLKDKERKIIFEEKLTNQPTMISMHPCGLMLAINYSKEIKLFSILPDSIYEVMNVKTNYNSIELKFSETGNYLVSNEQNMLIFYNPFTLKSLGYIEPPELKSKIVSFQITSTGEKVCYICSDHTVFIQDVTFSSYNQYENQYAAHIQQEPYTCFYFDQKVQKVINQNMSCQESENQMQKDNLFVGFTQKKYVTFVQQFQMVLYSKFGKELIAEFPIVDCYAVQCCVFENVLVVGTSKGTLRIYSWPILEAHCLYQILDQEKKKIKLKQPSFYQFQLWNHPIAIQKIHKLKFTNKLIVTNNIGTLAILNYSNPKNIKNINNHPSFSTKQIVFTLSLEGSNGDRKKLTQVINDTFFITKSEAQKRNKLIQKTQGDILKVQNQIIKEKSIMERKQIQQNKILKKNQEEKKQIFQQEKLQYLKKLQNDILIKENMLKMKKLSFETESSKLLKICTIKKTYEQSRNQKIDEQTKELINNHKEKIKKAMNKQKESIRTMKFQYSQTIKSLQMQFQRLIDHNFPNFSRKTLKSIKSLSILQKTSNKDRISLKIDNFTQENILNKINLNKPISNQQIQVQTMKVEEIQENNKKQEKILSEIKKLVKKTEFEDEELQKDFQKCLEQYNSCRFANLSLHSEVLKIRNQLIERKQVIDNKQNVVNFAYQERQKLENYKELVRGALTKLQEKKQLAHLNYTSKQKEEQLIFTELTNQMNYLEQKKSEAVELNRMIKISTKEEADSKKKLKDVLIKLQDLKKYLLLQGLNQDAEQKKQYHEQQNLLTSINFLKKRVHMEFTKQKKNKLLKQSAVNLVIKQNKNLLEQCNQLRQQTIEYEHEIKNLGTKLGEANKIISIESKLKDQNQNVSEQRNQLQAIRALFNNQMDQYKQYQGDGEIEEDLM